MILSDVLKQVKPGQEFCCDTYPDTLFHVDQSGLIRDADEKVWTFSPTTPFRSDWQIAPVDTVPLLEKVNHPLHYGGDTPYETIKVMEARLTMEEFIGAMKFNIYKYNDRAKMKDNESENYEKAQFYQNYLVEFMRRRKETKQP